MFTKCTVDTGEMRLKETQDGVDRSKAKLLHFKIKTSNQVSIQSYCCKLKITILPRFAHLPSKILFQLSFSPNHSLSLSLSIQQGLFTVVMVFMKSMLLVVKSRMSCESCTYGSDPESFIFFTMTVRQEH